MSVTRSSQNKLQRSSVVLVDRVHNRPAQLDLAVVRQHQTSRRQNSHLYLSMDSLTSLCLTINSSYQRISKPDLHALLLVNVN